MEGIQRPRPKSLALPPSAPPPLSAPSLLRTAAMSGTCETTTDALTRAALAQSKLEEDAYKRRLETYRQAQHQQALLVARLQSKLVQYKQRCSDLETKLGTGMGHELLAFDSPTAGGGQFGDMGGGGRSGGLQDLDDAHWRLDQERSRNESLLQLNRDLRHELEETRKVNTSLSSDLQKLSDDWEKLARQMQDREHLWKAEEQAYSDFYAAEHTKLLTLWKKVASAKRDFAEMKASTGRDMAQLKNTIARMGNQISSAVLTTAVSTPTPMQEAEHNAMLSRLTQELQIAQSSQETLRKQLKDRDDRISALENSLSEVEGKSQGLESELNRISVQELGLLQNSLREIGKLLLNDFDQHGLDEGHDVHLTSTPAIFIYDESGENPTIFAESIVSAVQAALNKRQLQIHQMQVSLSSSKEQSMVTRSHVESLESDLAKAEEKISQLTDLNEKIRDAFENTKIERDTNQRSLDNLKNEKNILEQQRKALASELDSALKSKNSLAANVSKLEKMVENCRDEVESLNIELDKTRDELTASLSQLSIEQDLGVKIREQLAQLGDDKERMSAENKNLRAQLQEITVRYDDVCFQFERSEDALKKWKMDAEILGEKLRSGSEKTDAIEKEKKKWAERARSAEDDKAKVETDLTDARNDIASLRRELLESERLKTDFEAKIEGLASRADSAENRKMVLENQLDSQREEFLREMSLATERVEIITEELGHCRRELEETLQVLDRTKADLSNAEKLHMEAVHLIESKEVSIRNISNTMDKLRDEKVSLEELESNLKTMLIEKDKKIDGLERQLAELRSKLTGEVNGLRDKLQRTEAEMRNQRDRLEKERQASEAKYTKEIAALTSNGAANEDKIRSDYEDRIKSLRGDLETEKKNEANKFNAEVGGLKQQMDNLRVQYEEALVRAENDKQQGLLLAQQDQQGLADKIRLLERELEDAKNEKERLKRECETKCTHEKNAGAALRSELIKLKNELETTRQDSIDTMKHVEIKISELEREKEGALMHIEELRNKIKSSEEREADLRRDLNDAYRKLKDAEHSGDTSKKEVVELRRNLSELAIDKEKTSSVVDQLREELGRRNTELATAKKEISKTQAKVKDLERIKADTETEVAALTVKIDSAIREKADSGRHVDDLQDQLAQSRSFITRLETEVTELKLKLDAETERRDEAEAQWRNTKKILDDAEANLGMAKGEEERLALKLAEAEERYSTRESQLMTMAEENKVREKKLMEEKHHLSMIVAQIQQQMEQLQLKHNSSENRLKLINDEKCDLERQKKEAETKLSQIQSGLKRMGIAHGAMENPDSVRRAMAALQTQMAALQQDRDTLASQLMSTKDQLATLDFAKNQCEDQLSAINRSLQAVRGDTKTKESAIINLEKEVTLKNGELNRMADKVRELEDSIKSRDDITRSVRSEKDTLKEELDRAKMRFDDARAQFESKWSKAEVNMRALEGDLHRMQLVLQQKDGHFQAIEEKVGNLQRNNNELEERCSSLTMTVEQLNIALEKTSQSEQDWKDKCNGLNRNVNENTARFSQLSERLRSLQREKAMLEQERNNLNEKWETASLALQDFKRQVQVLADKNNKLRIQTEEMTRNAIDKQLRMTLSESGKDDLRQALSEKLELQRKLDSVLEKVRDLERENRELERLKDNIPLKGVRSTTTPAAARENAAVSVLEDENSDLRRKISKLEAEIRELERRHSKHIQEATAQVKQERDFELERARAAKLQAERLLEARESNYRQQIQRLEQQIAHLKEQLGEEIRRRQTFLTRSFRTGQEIRSLRSALGESLRNVSLDPSEKNIESEARKLDTTLDLHKSASQSSLLSPHLRDLSPSYKTSTPIPK